MTDVTNAYFVGRTDSNMVAVAWYDGQDLKQAHALDPDRARALSDDLIEWAERVEEVEDDD